MHPLITTLLRLRRRLLWGWLLIGLAWPMLTWKSGAGLSWIFGSWFPTPWMAVLVVGAILLFYVGVVFAYYVVFPVMFEFFALTTSKGVQMMTDINNYLDFALTMFFAFGIA